MEALANMMVAAADLAEAEGRELRRQLVRAVTAVCAVIAGSLIGLAGLGFCLYGLFCALALVLPVPAAAALCGTLVIVVAAGLLWIARSMTKVASGTPGASPDQTKKHLVEAARRTDPLSLVRRHPLLMIGAAAGLGWIAGKGVKLSRLVQLAAALRPMALRGSQLAEAYLAHRCEAAATELDSGGADHG